MDVRLLCEVPRRPRPGLRELAHRQSQSRQLHRPRLREGLGQTGADPQGQSSRSGPGADGAPGSSSATAGTGTQNQTFVDTLGDGFTCGWGVPCVPPPNNTPPPPPVVTSVTAFTVYGTPWSVQGQKWWDNSYVYTPTEHNQYVTTYQTTTYSNGSWNIREVSRVLRSWQTIALQALYSDADPVKSPAVTAARIRAFNASVPGDPPPADSGACGQGGPLQSCNTPGADEGTAVVRVAGSPCRPARFVSISHSDISLLGIPDDHLVYKTTT